MRVNTNMSVLNITILRTSSPATQWLEKKSLDSTHRDPKEYSLFKRGVELSTFTFFFFFFFFLLPC